MLPPEGDTILTVAPASSSASFGFVNSTCSNPSAARIAIRLFKSFILSNSVPAAVPDGAGPLITDLHRPPRPDVQKRSPHEISALDRRPPSRPAFRDVLGGRPL